MAGTQQDLRCNLLDRQPGRIQIFDPGSAVEGFGIVDLFTALKQRGVRRIGPAGAADFVQSLRINGQGEQLAAVVSEHRRQRDAPSSESVSG